MKADCGVRPWDSVIIMIETDSRNYDNPFVSLKMMEPRQHVMVWKYKEKLIFIFINQAEAELAHHCTVVLMTLCALSQTVT